MKSTLLTLVVISFIAINALAKHVEESVGDPGWPGTCEQSMLRASFQNQKSDRPIKVEEFSLLLIKDTVVTDKMLGSYYEKDFYDYSKQSHSSVLKVEVLESGNIRFTSLGQTHTLTRMPIETGKMYNGYSYYTNETGKKYLVEIKDTPYRKTLSVFCFPAVGAPFPIFEARTGLTVEF